MLLFWRKLLPVFIITYYRTCKSLLLYSKNILFTMISPFAWATFYVSQLCLFQKPHAAASFSYNILQANVPLGNLVASAAWHVIARMTLIVTTQAGRVRDPVQKAGLDPAVSAVSIYGVFFFVHSLLPYIEQVRHIWFQQASAVIHTHHCLRRWTSREIFFISTHVKPSQVHKSIT